MHRKQLVALIVAASLSLVGCGPKKQPTKTAKPNPPSDAMTNVDTRMSELQQRAAELDAVARQLPGRDLKSDRDLVVQAFDRSSAALVLLGGPSPGGAFRQQLRIIDTVRQEIKTLSPSIADDPTIDSGLRALYNALTSVRERLFPDDPRVRQMLDVVHERVVDLDAVRGPMHSLVVAQVFSAVATTIQMMAGELSGRSAAAEAPTAAPPAPSAASVAPATAAPPASPSPAAPSAPLLPPSIGVPVAPAAPATPLPPATR